MRKMQKAEAQHCWAQLWRRRHPAAAAELLQPQPEEAPDNADLEPANAHEDPEIVKKDYISGANEEVKIEAKEEEEDEEFQWNDFVEAEEEDEEPDEEFQWNDFVEAEEDHGEDNEDEEEEGKDDDDDDDEDTSASTVHLLSSDAITVPASGGVPTDAWEIVPYSHIVASDIEDIAWELRERIDTLCWDNTLGVVFMPLHGIADPGKKWLSETVQSGLDNMQRLQWDAYEFGDEWSLFDDLPESTKDIMKLSGEEDMISLCLALQKLTSNHRGEIVQLEVPTWTFVQSVLPNPINIPPQMRFKPHYDPLPCDFNIEEMSLPCRPNWDKQVCSWCVPCFDETVGHWDKTVRVATLGDLFYNLAPFHTASDIYEFYKSQPRLSLKRPHRKSRRRNGGGAPLGRGGASVAAGRNEAGGGERGAGR